MKPIINKPTVTPNGSLLTNITTDPFCFMFNSLAMGDVIAGVPAVKYMVENFYTEPDSYFVVAKEQFRDLFPFVPDHNFRDFDKKENLWNLPRGVLLGVLNKKNEPGITRNTPKHIHLGEYAAFVMSDRFLPRSVLNYVPLNPVDISKFNVDFSKAVILVTSYRDVTRMWQPEYILEVAKWVKEKGLIPVFIGKTGMDTSAKESVQPKTALPEDISEHGVDLRNQTSISELASIFSHSKAVCGLDSGPIHLAGTTSIPIVCGYTSVSAENRMPIRKEGKTIPIVPNIHCINCESRWRSNLWNFENCYLNTLECVKKMTPDKFINALSTII